MSSAAPRSSVASPSASERAAWPSAARWVPDDHALPALGAAVAGCRGCDLWRDATQAVFGSGPSSAEVMLVGEQPGDREDLAGEPFVGPAGALLDRALEDAGIHPDTVFRTNAVKHFRHVDKGHKRIHKTPSRWQVAQCQPWLLAELDAVRPRTVVLLGATAGQTVFGPGSPSATTGAGPWSGRRVSGRSRSGCSRRCTRHPCCARGTDRRTTTPSSPTSGCSRAEPRPRPRVTTRAARSPAPG
jgi:uracil-DNA glycosylase family protein